MVHEALAFRAADRGNGAVNITDPKSGAVIVSEIELREIAVQILLAAMLIDAVHPALEN
jgi:hypothetical protein